MEPIWQKTIKKKCPLFLSLVTATVSNVVMVKGASIINLDLEIKVECSGKQKSRTDSEHCPECLMYPQSLVNSGLPTQNYIKSIS